MNGCGDSAESDSEFITEEGNGADDHHGDQGGDETVFYGGDPLSVLIKDFNQLSAEAYM